MPFSKVRPLDDSRVPALATAFQDPHASCSTKFETYTQTVWLSTLAKESSGKRIGAPAAGGTFTALLVLIAELKPDLDPVTCKVILVPPSASTSV